MKITSITTGAVVALISLLGCVTHLHAQETAFTYQGRLNNNGAPAEGIYDLHLTIFDALAGGNIVGGPLTNSATTVSNGLFTVTLDFGAGIFSGEDRWLRIGVRTNGGAGFMLLSPRQQITATPYAVAAGNLTGTLPASQLSGAIANLNFPASPTFSGTVTATSFSGNGAGLASLNAGNIGSGILNDARLSSNVPLRDENQTFMGANTFNNAGNIFRGSFVGNGAGLTNLNLLPSIPAGGIILTTNAGTFGFAIASAPLVGNGPNTVIAADVNADGNMDLISVDGATLTSALSVLTNNGSGGFVLSSSPVVGTSPRSVAAADVNGDSAVDLITANFGADGLSVLTNNGSGGYVLSSSPATGDGPQSVAAADVNGDGHVDLISANSSDDTISVLTNNGTGGFVTAASPIVGASPISVVAADVNGDTTMDLIIANFGDDDISILLGTGSGSFVFAASPNAGNGPISLVTADVNSDGKVDVISADQLADTLSVMTNNGAGTFGLNATLTVGDSPSSVTAGDVNGDGKVDLISANELGDTLSVLTNNGSGGFVLAVSPAVGNTPLSVVAADVNGDGSLDLASANQTEDRVTVLFNTLSATTTTATFQGNFSGSTLNVNGTLSAGNVSVSGFNIIGQSFFVATNNSTLTPTSGYVKLSAASPVTLDATTAIANGPAIGAILIIEGNTDANSVTMPNNANTRLVANRVLGLRDILTLIWNGSNWLELSYSNN